MAIEEYFYQGAGYNLSPTYGESFLGFEYRIPTRDFGFPSDPRTANQLQAVSQKVSTGAKTIEVSGVNITGGGPMKLIDTIPKPFFKEINRLKKLVGVDLTFHGPLVEATGFAGRQGWTEDDRRQAEIQMISAVERSHELDPKGNLVVTFHSSNGLPDPQTKIINEKGEEELKEFWTIDEHTGQFRQQVPTVSHLTGEGAKDPKKFLERINNESWYSSLQDVNFNVNRGTQAINEVLKPRPDDTPEIIEKKKSFLELYGKLGTPEAQKVLKEFEEQGIPKEWVNEKINAVTFGEINLRQAYQAFQSLFDRAYEASSQSDRKKLEAFREELKPKLSFIQDPEKIGLLAEELQKGIQVLRTINTPQIFKPMREWAIDKAGESFANVALDSYKKFKDTSPIISVENPPVGMGLARAEDLRDLVEKAREKFIEKAQEKLHISKSEAKKQAEKLIGVTWDVGHINMLRGRGYEEKHLVEQTKKIAPFVKHVHLSDNFGLEHTELPMGMGNVPTKKMLDIINEYNKKVKKIVETGDWFQPFKTTPFRETLAAFGSPVYENMAPYWNQAANASAGYFAGQGVINPPIHHSIWGAGFSTLPVELGGQMAGKSRVSGAPIE